MTTLELKSNFHKLIDNFENDSVLSKFYFMLSQAQESKVGSLWKKLSYEEQQELILSDIESQNPENLIPHSEMIKKYQKWL